MNILAAQVPETPDAPTTNVVGDDVQINWVAPDDMGSPINDYKIRIVGQDGEDYLYNQDLCANTNPLYLTLSSCSIPIYMLRDWPFSLEWGSSISASLVAVNSYGDSDMSEFGNGAIITTFPDAPVNLQDIVELRTESQLVFSWEEGPANGGATVTAYSVSFD